MSTFDQWDWLDQQECGDIGALVEETGLVNQIPHVCSECGNAGACGYDVEGRPYAHIIRDRDDGGEHLLLQLWGGSFW